MADADSRTAPEGWTEFMDQWNSAFQQAVDRNLEAQAEFVDAWTDSLAESMDDERMADGLDGFARSFDVWTNATETMLARVSDSLEGEDVDVKEFRDIWLDAANDAFTETMSTSAYAAATGSAVGEALDVREQVDEATRDTLETLGLATADNVEEVGERLVELERRQHAIEEKLDRVLTALEE